MARLVKEITERGAFAMAQRRPLGGQVVGVDSLDQSALVDIDAYDATGQKVFLRTAFQPQTPPVEGDRVILDYGNVHSGSVFIAGSALGGPNSSGEIGAGFSAVAANLFFAGPASGADATPAFRALVLADLPVVDFAHGGTGNTAFSAQEIPYSDGTKFVGETTFAWDTSNKRLGIGVAVPSYSISLPNTGSHTVGVEAAASGGGVAGGGLTLRGGFGDTSGSGSAGGAITYRAGDAGGDNTVNRAGGGISGQAGASKGSSAGGLVSFVSGKGGAGTGTTGATGGALNMTGGAGGDGSSTGGAGGPLMLVGGAGGTSTTNGNGGSATLKGGAGLAANPGSIVLAGGQSSGSGGSATIAAGTGDATTTGAGGNASLTAGDGGGATSSAGGNGGALTLSAGNANGDGTANKSGGAVSITAGDSKRNGTTGSVTINAGNGTTSNTTPAVGGNINLNGGTGAVRNAAAASVVSGAGGAVTLRSGTGGANSVGSTTSTGGAGGALDLLGGTGGAATGTAANVGGAGSPVSLAGGTGGASSGGTSNTGGAGGDVTLKGGVGGAGATAAGAGGAIIFQTAVTTTLAEAGRFDKNGRLGLGTGATVSARLHVIDTTEAARFGYDASNYLKVQVSSSGVVTFDAVGSGASFSFADQVSIAGTTGNTLKWNNSATAPTTAAGTPTTRYGGDTKYLGDPSAWLLVNIGGTEYKVPAYA